MNDKITVTAAIDLMGELGVTVTEIKFGGIIFSKKDCGAWRHMFYDHEKQEVSIIDLMTVYGQLIAMQTKTNIIDLIYEYQSTEGIK